MRQNGMFTESQPAMARASEARVGGRHPRNYTEVSEGGAIACLSVEQTASEVEFEGLLWRSGRVVCELTGSSPLKGRSVDRVLRDVIAQKIDTINGSHRTSSRRGARTGQS
jgi:hypothetical protein